MQGPLSEKHLVDRLLFELADEVTYTGCPFPVANLRKWSVKATAELKRLEIP